MLLTPVQYERLPSLLQTIVDADRQIKNCLAPKVLTLAQARDIRGKLRHRRDLTGMAHKAYGNELKGRDGTARQ